MANLEHMRSFLAVHRSGSMTAAARTLGISQPTITAHVRALEAEAGGPLVRRLARGVSPTPLGDALASDIAPLVDALDESVLRLRGADELPLVQLGGPADYLAGRGLIALAPVVGRSVRVHVRTGIAEPLIAALAAGELDVVIATRRVTERRVRYVPLVEERLLAVASPAWAARLRGGGRPWSPARLGEAPLVAFDGDLPLIREYWIAARGEPVSLPEPALVVGDLRAICVAVAAGAGVSVVPDYLAEPLSARGDLVVLDDLERAPRGMLHLATRLASERRPGVRAVVQALRGS